ncbi:MAG: electron transfer flavoprotein subunit alpha/FixB family protein [Nitrososphaerales archaeon]|jgi:electron transfer flavoprotein alpha subunit
MSEVWAFSESVTIANEVVSAAKEIAVACSGQAVVVEVGRARSSVSSPGKKLVIKGPGLTDESPEMTAGALYLAAREAKPAVVLVGATRNGKEVASRLAVKLGSGCLPDLSKVSAEGEALVGERGEYAGKVMTKLSSPFPCVAAIKTGAYPTFSGTGGEILEKDVGAVARSSQIVAVTKKEVSTVDLRAAKVIVSAGRGVKKKEDLEMVGALAKALGGALGCSRPLASDLGWLPEECHIGLTGVNVKPELYLAVGISGQLQHVAGIKDSKVIAAINSDKDAPIFQAADYGVVGDLYQLVPAIQRVLSSRHH